MATHILVIGATGATGILFCENALKDGHELTIYACDPKKLSEDVKDHNQATVVEGQLNDEVNLKKAVNGGASVFVSFAGPVMGKSTALIDCMKTLFPLLIEAKYDRALILGTPSWTAPKDVGALKWKAAVTLAKISGRYHELNSLGEFVTSSSIDDLRWTLFRVPFLGNGETQPVTATYTGTGLDGMFLARSSIAAWVLEQIMDGEWVGQAPLLCN